MLIWRSREKAMRSLEYLRLVCFEGCKFFEIGIGRVVICGLGACEL